MKQKTYWNKWKIIKQKMIVEKGRYSPGHVISMVEAK